MAKKASYLSSVCEIKTITNELFATGYISEFDDNQILVRDRYGEMPVSEFGRIVKVCVYNQRLGFRVLVGKVFASTNSFMQIVDIVSLVEFERRNFFRVSVHIKGTVRRRATDIEEEQMAEFPGLIKPSVDVTPYPMMVLDISLGGILMSTNQEYEAGDQLRVTFRMRQEATLNCSVSRDRTESGSDTMLYGCEFAPMSDALSSELCAFIFQRQRKQIDQRKLV